jgi:RNA polymerase sigma-70 factor (ECF subfamily)
VKREPVTTEEIIRDFKQRDREAAFRLLFERYYRQTYHFFRRKGFSQEDARDLTQETFISVYKGLEGLKQEDRFENWLFAIALNVYRDELDRRHSQKRWANEIELEETAIASEQLQPVGSWAAAAVNPAEAVLEKEKKEKLREALEELPQQMRRCAYLRVIREMSDREIAQTLGISVGTVKAHLHQARRLLGERLREIFGEMNI